MLRYLPVEVVEQILLYLSIKDIFNLFSAFNKPYHLLPHYFWKKICLRENFNFTNEVQDWCECFKAGVNRKLGLYSVLETVPPGIIEHVYFKILIMRHNNVDTLDTYNVYIFDRNCKFNLVQTIDGRNCQFMDEFMVVKNEFSASIFMFSFSSNMFECIKAFPEEEDEPSIVGISKTHCLSYNQKFKHFYLYAFEDKIKQKIEVPHDVRFVIHTIFHRRTNRIFISVISLIYDFKIKVFDLNAQTWTLDLLCFYDSGIGTVPNIWVGQSYIGCCDVSYRVRGNYYGPFRVWDTKGNLVFHADIETSQKYYIQCFFEEHHIILTTSDKTIRTFTYNGRCIAEIKTTKAILDIKQSPKHMIFVFLEDNECIEVYDWKEGCQLYSIKLRTKINATCFKSLSSDYLYCVIVNKEHNIYEVVSFV